MARSKPTTNRANKVRIKRSQQSRKPSQRTGKRVADTARQMPPVMVRGDSYNKTSKAKKERKTPRVKRRYDIALPSTGSKGVEMRLPSTPVYQPGWRIISFMLVAGMIALIYYLWTSPSFQVQYIDVQGVMRLSPMEISQTLNVINKPVFTLDPQQMESDLVNAYPELTDITVRIGLPANILVNLSERVPMISWVQEAETYWIDGNGFAFKPRGEAEKLVAVYANVPPPMPMMPQVQDATVGMEDESDLFVSHMAQEMIDAIFVLKTQAPVEAGLSYDGQHGFGWIDNRGWQVFFGTNVDDIESKINVYHAIVNKLSSEGITPAFISIEYLHSPYYY
jgi:hypothetical protein